MSAMTPPSQRGWFRFSIRMLVLFTLLGAIGLVLRVDYLKRWAAFHEREADRVLMLDTASLDEAFDRVLESTAHRNLANGYNMAIWAPWTVIEESPEAAP